MTAWWRGAMLALGLTMAGAQAMAMAEESFGMPTAGAGGGLDFPPENYSPYQDRPSVGGPRQGEWLPPQAQGVPGAVVQPAPASPVTPTLPGVWPSLTVPGATDWGLGALPWLGLPGTATYPLTVPGLLYPFVW